MLSSDDGLIRYLQVEMPSFASLSEPAAIQKFAHVRSGHMLELEMFSRAMSMKNMTVLHTHSSEAKVYRRPISAYG